MHRYRRQRPSETFTQSRLEGARRKRNRPAASAGGLRTGKTLTSATLHERADQNLLWRAGCDAGRRGLVDVGAAPPRRILFLFRAAENLWRDQPEMDFGHPFYSRSRWNHVCRGLFRSEERRVGKE